MGEYAIRQVTLTYMFNTDPAPVPRVSFDIADIQFFGAKPQEQQDALTGEFKTRLEEEVFLDLGVESNFKGIHMSFDLTNEARRAG